MRPQTDEHDYQHQDARNIEVHGRGRQGQITLRFRGSYKWRIRASAYDNASAAKADTEKSCVVEQFPAGRQIMVMMLAPGKKNGGARESVPALPCKNSTGARSGQPGVSVKAPASPDRLEPPINWCCNRPQTV